MDRDWSDEPKSSATLVLESPRSFFGDQVDGALDRLNFEPLPLSKKYLVGLLEHFMFSRNLFPVDDETGRTRRDTLAELYLKARSTPPPQCWELLKRLGDSSLYICGFFGDSLSRKIVDMDYYVDMGCVAYGALSSSGTNGDLARVYDEYSVRFAAFVDVLTYISQESMIQSNEDLLRLYDRYLTTGSKLAEGQLLEKGLLTPDVNKAKQNKM